ncbi:SCO6880 family protein [Plantibacter sp. RU18]|uniref:SCO6880 family protein n=1 Tax=Plantibacter sp. RU18 TaxID=3158143 RepID=UPI003D361138
MSNKVGYTGWFERKSPGIFKLTLVGTVGLVAGIMLVMYVASKANNLLVTIGLVLAVVLFELLYGWEYDGKTIGRRLGERRDTPRRAKRGETDYVTGVMANLTGSNGGHPLPGILASTKLLRGIDGYGNPFDVIHYPSKGLFAVTFRCYPDGDGMADQDLINLMVAKYAAWIATLSVEDGVVGAVSVIDSAPGTGVELQESVEAERDPDGPPAAALIMDQVVRDLPNHSSDVTGYVTVAWRQDAMTIPAKTPQDVVVEIAKRLPGHQAALAAGGAGDPIPMTEPELVETARLAYDPELAVGFELLRAREQDVELGWADAGPSTAEESGGAYRHDGVASFTLEMRRPPRGIIFDNHLLRLLQPNPAFLRKRVAVFYQAVSAEKAQSQAENAVRAEDFAAGQQKGRRTANTRRGIRVAANLDEEISAGASLVPFAMLATCTYEDTVEGERRARNTLTSLMTSSRMRVRRSKGLQAALFHMSLPFGMLPWEFSDNPFKK